MATPARYDAASIRDLRQKSIENLEQLRRRQSQFWQQKDGERATNSSVTDSFSSTSSDGHDRRAVTKRVPYVLHTSTEQIDGIKNRRNDELSYAKDSQLSFSSRSTKGYYGSEGHLNFSRDISIPASRSIETTFDASDHIDDITRGRTSNADNYTRRYLASEQLELWKHDLNVDEGRRYDTQIDRGEQYNARVERRYDIDKGDLRPASDKRSLYNEVATSRNYPYGLNSSDVFDRNPVISLYRPADSKEKNDHGVSSTSLDHSTAFLYRKKDPPLDHSTALLYPMKDMSLDHSTAHLYPAEDPLEMSEKVRSDLFSTEISDRYFKPSVDPYGKPSSDYSDADKFYSSTRSTLTDEDNETRGTILSDNFEDVTSENVRRAGRLSDLKLADNTSSLRFEKSTLKQDIHEIPRSQNSANRKASPLPPRKSALSQRTRFSVKPGSSANVSSTRRTSPKRLGSSSPPLLRQGTPKSILRRRKIIDDNVFVESKYQHTPTTKTTGTRGKNALNFSYSDVDDGSLTPRAKSVNFVEHSDARAFSRGDTGRTSSEREERYANKTQINKTVSSAKDLRSDRAGTEKMEGKGDRGYVSKSNANTALKQSSKDYGRSGLTSNTESKSGSSTADVKKSQATLTTARPRTEGRFEYERLTVDETKSKENDERFKFIADGAKSSQVLRSMHKSTMSASRTPHYLSATDGSYIEEIDLDEDVGSLVNDERRTSVDDEGDSKMSGRYRPIFTDRTNKYEDVSARKPNDRTPALNPFLTQTGNDRKNIKIVRDLSRRPKSDLFSSHSEGNLSNDASSTNGQSSKEYSKLLDTRQGPTLLGYDWIAGVLDNEASSTEQAATDPDKLIEGLKEFRRKNRQDCVGTAATINGDAYDRPFTPELHNPEHTCIHGYSLNDRLFTEPVSVDSKGVSMCPVCLTSRKEPTQDSPGFVRVSIPRSKMESPYKIKPHRRRSFDAVDSCALSQHCLAGYECSRPSNIPTASSVDLKDAVNGVKSQMITTEEEARKLADMSSKTSQLLSRRPPPLRIPDLSASVRSHLSDGTTTTRSASSSTRSANTSARNNGTDRGAGGASATAQFESTRSAVVSRVK